MLLLIASGYSLGDVNFVFITEVHLERFIRVILLFPLCLEKVRRRNSFVI